MTRAAAVERWKPRGERVSRGLLPMPWIDFEQFGCCRWPGRGQGACKTHSTRGLMIGSESKSVFVCLASVSRNRMRVMQLRTPPLKQPKMPLPGPTTRLSARPPEAPAREPSG
jgi:hypothetical protein